MPTLRLSYILRDKAIPLVTNIFCHQICECDNIKSEIFPVLELVSQFEVIVGFFFR